VFWRLLANCMASCSSFGCRVRVRGRSLARVQEDRLGHGVQSSTEKSMWIMLRPRAVLVSDQRMLWRSLGQLTVLLSQSTRKFATSKPSSALACQVLSLKVGPMRSIWRAWLETRLLPHT
jgi:hypothetical protein